jgi:hypothetical protein
MRRALRFRAQGFLGLATPVREWTGNLLNRLGLRDGVGLRWKASHGVPDAVLQ